MGDAHTIEELSVQISRKLKQVKKVNWLIKGYQLNELNQITHLNISKVALKGKWPPALFKLEHLEFLDIQQNDLEYIPKEISQLKKLKCIDIRNNQINALPDSFMDILELAKLYLGNNTFTEVPKLLSSCQNLRLIDFTNNQLTKGLEYLLKSTSITNIYLEKNDISQFPFHQIRDKQLLELNLVDNPLDIVPDEIPHVGRLYV